MVAVSNKFKFVFLKSRKTAGTSIERALFPFCTGPNDDLPLQMTADRYGEGTARGPAPDGWRPHIPASRVRRRLGREKWDSYFRFTAVRNPFDRVVSHFFWLRRDSEIVQSDSFDEVRAAFRQFCVRPRYATDKDIVMIDDEFVAQDAIRYEALSEDLARIAAKLGFEEEMEPLPEFNKGIRKWGDVPVADFYDEKSIDAVKRTMQWVFENFDYSEDPRDQNAPDAKI